MKKISTEELYQQWLDGKSIHDLNQETGIGKWALYKRFQRHDVQSPADVQFDENDIAITGKSNGIWILIALLIIGAILFGYWIYHKLKERKTKSNIDNGIIIEY